MFISGKNKQQKKLWHCALLLKPSWEIIFKLHELTSLKQCSLLKIIIYYRPTMLYGMNYSQMTWYQWNRAKFHALSKRETLNPEFTRNTIIFHSNLVTILNFEWSLFSQQYNDRMYISSLLYDMCWTILYSSEDPSYVKRILIQPI